MSEEILKALMQLFAIITKQDEGASMKERNFVEMFLKQQLGAEKVNEYLSLYDNFLGVTEEKNTDEAAKKKLTNVKDSVKTLSICKKINKTLTQKQKVVVLIRLFELINSSRSLTSQRMQIIDTVSTAFNIEPEEYKIIEQYCLSDDVVSELDSASLLLVGHDLHPGPLVKKLISESLDGILSIIHINSVDMYFLKYLGHNTLFLNGLPVNCNQIYLFASGSTIKLPIGEPIYYSDISSKFLSDRHIQQLSFNAENLEYTFPNGKVGLRNIQISEGPGRLIGIMGGSGAGKTTLLNVMAGLEKPSNGKVLINGINIHTEKEKIEGVIGYVAQDDILFEELTVYQNIYFNAKLCFGNLSELRIHELSILVLKNLGLYGIRDIKVGNVLNKKISGGQRKRLNIALELIREPSVLFLDEPTSGLSSRDSENVIDLLKELSLKGKLIYVVIHQPSSDIYKMFDKMVILDEGGYQIYYGNPVEAVMYFKRITNQINNDIGQCPSCGNVNPELIFNTIDAKIVDEYGNPTEDRKNSPQTWNEYFLKLMKIEKVNDAKEKPPKTLFLPNWLKQLNVFTKRDFLSKLSNTQYLLVNLLEAPVLALVLAFIIRYVDDPAKDTYYYGNNDNIPAYLFMSIIVALFMGLTVSAEEIIRDAKILRRESFLNLSRSGYLFSKISILFFMSAIQTLSFVIVGNLILGINGMIFSYWIMLFSVSCCANMMGLNVSATFNSAVTIYILIPILLIPQMILSGAIFSFDKLNKAVGSVEKVPIIADVMTSRWAFEGLAVKQFRDNSFEKHFYELEKAESYYDFKQVYWLPSMTDKLNTTLQLLEKKDPESLKKLENNVSLIKNELAKIALLEPGVKLTILPDTLTVASKQATFEKTKEYLDLLKMHFSAKFSEVNALKDNKINNAMKTKDTESLFVESKKRHYNQSLADLVKKFDNKHRILEYNNELIQIYDPVFLAPTLYGKSYLDYRTHLYAPNKHLAGRLFDTFYFNLTMIWLMSALFFLTLYLEIFRKMLDGIATFYSIAYTQIKKMNTKHSIS